MFSDTLLLCILKIPNFVLFKADGNRMQAPEAESAAKFGRGLHTLPRQPQTKYSWQQ